MKKALLILHMQILYTQYTDFQGTVGFLTNYSRPTSQEST